MAGVNTQAPGGLYRAVWRWHFYAGLLVLPVLLWLAITGGLYLYKAEIERAVYAGWSRIAARGPVLPLETMAGRVARQAGGRVEQIARPADPGESWRMTLALPGGTRRMAFVDPHDGRVLGTTAPGGIMMTVRNLHSLIITGPIGNALIEIVAGWAIVLVVSGVYLWWPRGTNPAIGVRGRPAQRLFWRDLHASTGIVAGAVILFLATTGLPWSGVWGAEVQTYVATHGLGRPKSPGPAPWEIAKGDDAGGHGGHGAHDAAQTLPWSMQRAPVPHGAGHAGMAPIGADRALAVAQARGIAAPWTLSLPAAPSAPYLVSATIARAQDAHAVYVDATGGAVLQDARYRDFGRGAQLIEWGIATHQGQQYGEPNRLVMLAGCIAIALLAISAPVMWWKRRPRGRLGAPPGRSGAGLLAIMAIGGILLPLTGLTMLAALIGDRLVQALRRVPG
jgi:uncharacterized iron-regulated membrane protein